jgi:hypothetical protein
MDFRPGKTRQEPRDKQQKRNEKSGVFRLLTQINLGSKLEAAVMRGK